MHSSGYVPGSSVETARPDVPLQDVAEVAIRCAVLGGLRCETPKRSVNWSFFSNSEVNLEINLSFMTFVISKLDVCQM